MFLFSRLLRYNDKLTKWGGVAEERRRHLDFERYGLTFSPVRAKDSGTYLCLLNNRREPDAPIVLTVQGERRWHDGRPIFLPLSGCSFRVFFFFQS